MASLHVPSPAPTAVEPGGHLDQIDRLSDERGIISVPSGAPPFRVGERVAIIPNAGSVVVHTFSELVGVRAGRVERVWSIAARGCMQ